jgi:poly-gamma-glutamate synthesis protein (capsule biosynthesis protein)
MMMLKPVYTFFILIFLLSACAQQPALPPVNGEKSPAPVEITASTEVVTPTESELPSATTIPVNSLTVWADSILPAMLLDQVSVLPTAATSDEAALKLSLVQNSEDGVEWIYALVAPFSSLLDEMALADLVNDWQGVDVPSTPIYVDLSTRAALEGLLGAPAANVQVLPADEILAASWGVPDALALVPFEALEPRWKVIVLDGQSPVRNDFQAAAYPLKAYFGWQGEADSLAALQQAVIDGTLPELTSNRDPSRMTVLIMTGVTALVRATAVKMEEKGMTYPGEAVRDWLINADLTHISNEVSFSPVCPDPVSYPGPLIFCSKPEYIELLDDVGTDIIELTGNHGIDWGRDALAFSLDLYRQRGWTYYAAGEDVFKAREAVTVEHNGNKLAFIGCNPAGPEFIWATETQSGVANCDYPWMWERIRQLSSEGYQVIATFQYFETYRHYVEPFEERDFRSMADAGAVIVSGSQAHHPMAMEFYQGSFIHYGLGNLFFDQMHTGGLIPDATRKEFIDRYVFYNNQHISTELLTAMLEDYARPRPMTASERYDFLTEIFAVTRWGDVP